MGWKNKLNYGARWLLSANAAKATWVRLLLLIVVCLVLLLGLDPATHNASLIWRNAIPVVLLAFLIYALCARWLFSIWLTVLVTVAFYGISAVKQRNMNMPLLPGDIVLKQQVLDNLGFFLDYLAHGFKAIIAIVVVLVVSWFIWKLDRRGARPSWITRMIWVVIPLICFYTMFGGYGFWSSVYSNKSLDGFALWDPAKSIKHSGLVAGFVRMGQASRVKVPKANASVVRDFAKQHQEGILQRENRQVPARLPDIVVVQSEAFFDPGIMKQISPGEYDPNFYRLSETGIHGTMKAPTYGGGTIRTEFETLTGYPMRAFPSVLYPYYGLAAGWMPSVPTRLASMGYTTTLFHPFLSSFWNRREVMPMLGFQKMYFEKSFGAAKRAGLYISDAALFHFLLDHLKGGDSKPQYVMAITMENHGPWNRDPGKLIDVLKGHQLPTGLSAKGKQEMQYYLSHLVNGDKALAWFAQKLMARKRWTILMFYGDHLPALNAAFKDVGFDDGGTHSTQKTHYMILSNRPLLPREVDLHSYQLPGVLFDLAGLPLDGYLDFDATATQDRMKSKPHDTTMYSRVLYNAARMEVACRSKLTAKGTCGAYEGDHTVEHARTEKSPEQAPAHGQASAPSVAAPCAGGSCSNGDLRIDPSGIAVCNGKSHPAMVTVTWHAKEAASGVVRLWIHNPGTEGAATLWAEKAANGHAKTGAWVVPGMHIILTDARSGKKLSMLTVPPTQCATSQHE